MIFTIVRYHCERSTPGFKCSRTKIWNVYRLSVCKTNRHALSAMSGYGLIKSSICYVIFTGYRYGVGSPSRWQVYAVQHLDSNNRAICMRHFTFTPRRELCVRLARICWQRRDPEPTIEWYHYERRTTWSWPKLPQSKLEMLLSRKWQEQAENAFVMMVIDVDNHHRMALLRLWPSNLRSNTFC